jgi:outer membrane protein assembly factor BamD (BamD/ComL family)
MRTRLLPGARPGTLRRLAGKGGLLLLLALASSAWGCMTGAESYLPGGETVAQLNLFAPPKAPPPPVESVVLRPDGLVPDKKPATEAETKLAGARDLFRREEYSKAEALYHHLAENKKNPSAVVQEALYYEAECLRLQGHFPKAADTYVDLLNKFPQNPYREQAVQHMFDIANYWLDDTRAEMREDLEKREGKRWFVWPRFISFDKTKPLLDREGRAIEKLEQVRYNDVTGPLADTALFMCGTVKLYNEDYREAAYYFTQIREKHPNSPLAPKATELAIYAKNLSTGGADYDGRPAAEARKLVQAAFECYPELAREKKDFLMRQLVGIDLQQAEKDFKMAEFWERTGHPGSAYFYYEVVRRRYPNTKYAELAAQKRDQLQEKLEREHNGDEIRTPPPNMGNAGPSGAQPEQGPQPRPLPGGNSGAPRPLPPDLGNR